MVEYIERDALLKKAIAGRRFVFTMKDALNDTYIVETCYKDLVDIVNSIPAADVEPAKRWIPCSEKMPEEGEDVLLWDSFDKTTFTGHYYKYDGWTVDGYDVGRFPFDITHWRPLPEPPEMDGGAK